MRAVLAELIFVGVLSSSVWAAGWVQSSQQNYSDLDSWNIGATDVIRAISIADARGTGAAVLVTGLESAGCYEVTSSSPRWVLAGIGFYKNIWGGYFPRQIKAISIGDGRGDAKARIYYAGNDDSYSGKGIGVYEMTYAGGATWSGVNVATAPVFVSSLLLGDVRGDGVPRVYGGRSDGFLVECRWTGSAWTVANTSSGQGASLSALASGKWPGETTSRLFLGSASGTLRQFTWSGSTWTSVTVASETSAVNALWFGDLRGTGAARLYVGLGSGDVREYEKTGGSYIGSTSTTAKLGVTALAAGDARNDGITRLCAASQDTRVYEMTWSSATNSWGVVVVGTATDGLNTIAVGSALGDGKNRVYAGGGNSKLYEYTYASDQAITGAGSSTSTVVVGNNYFDPRTGAKARIFYTPQPEETHLIITVYDLFGQAVRRLVDGTPPTSWPVEWDGKDAAGNLVAPGLYFVVVEGGTSSATGTGETATTKLSLKRRGIAKVALIR